MQISEKVVTASTKWYNAHKAHVEKLKKSTKLSYEPSKGDLHHPELWKGAHWNWFHEQLKKSQLNLF